MSNAELLAIIIGGGSKEESALALAQRLLSIFGSLHGVAEAGTRELEDVKGIGKAKIAHIRAAFALGRRLSAEPVSKGAAMKGSQEVVRQFGERLKDLKKEVFLCLLLDTKHNIILEDPIAEGSLDETVVHPREVFKRAVKESASAVLFVHNHPSGNPEPSAQDRRLTQRLCEVGNLVGIPVLDHLIIARDGYYSFAEHGGIRT
jgi:DNA repair protein RadC